MCGIIGVIDEHAVEKAVTGLKLLEYRGYDAAGVAYKNGGELAAVKSVGDVSVLAKKLSGVDGRVAIGHTRWATHGKNTLNNAHPFFSNDKSFALVHNGIIENYSEIKKELLDDGYVFSGETDSEAAVMLLQKNYNGNVLKALIKTASALAGAFAVAVTTRYDDCIYAIKKGSPLCVACNGKSAYLCSDVNTLRRFSDKVAVVPDGAAVVLSAFGVKLFSSDGEEIKANYRFVGRLTDTLCEEYDFMFREIMEIPEKIRDAHLGYFDSGRHKIPKKLIRRLRRIYLIGCGTAYNSGLYAASEMRKLLPQCDIIPVLSSEFVYAPYPADNRTLAIILTQSGETADTLRAAEKLSLSNVYVMAFTNAANSSVCFIADEVINIFAGQEIAVAGTKTYNCMLVLLILTALDIALEKREISYNEWKKQLKELYALPLAADRTLMEAEKIAELCASFDNVSAVYYLGRGRDYATAAEGSLKLKEISYVHSEAYASGELKHGTLALFEKGVAAVNLCTDSNLLKKSVNACFEAAARNADTIAVTPFCKELFPNDTKLITIPPTDNLFAGVISIIPLQLMAYYFAKRRNRDVDKPRNLAKSVTVE